MPEHILFITCSSGHGHMVATTNIQAEITAQSPDAHFHTLDIVDYLYPVKPIIVDLWNAGIRQDSILAHLLPRAINLYEFFYENFLEKKLLKDLQSLFDSFPIQRVIDTQPIFTPLLIKQTAKASPSPVAYHKVLTDLPVNANHPFFSGIKKRNHFSNLSFLMHSAEPLTQPTETQALFWKSHCNLAPKHVSTIWSKPVHVAFKTVPNDQHTIHVNIHPAIAGHEGFDQNGILPLPEHARVTTLMMGSQGLEVIHDYYQKIRQEFSSKTLEVPHYVFIACSRNETLFNNLMKDCLQQKTVNPNLKIIPLQMQPPENVASLMWRSQTILLRASGLSCIEQLAMDEAAKKAGVVFEPKRYIHSHCKKHMKPGLSPAEQSDFLLRHSVGHEKANTVYLQEKLGAELTRVDVIEFPA